MKDARHFPFLLLILLVISLSFGIHSYQAYADTPTPTPTSSATTTVTPISTPTPTSTPTTTDLTVTPAIRALTCGASTTVTVAVNQGGSAVGDGTVVQFSTSLGVGTPSAAQTVGGSATFTYTAPSNVNGAATVTASALGASSSAAINLFCGSVPPPGGVPPTGQAAVLNQPVVTCLASTASVSFSWTPSTIFSIPGATFAYLDLTLQNNGFLPGTFLSAGPLDVTTSQIIWNGILPGLNTFWRVNTFNGATWTPSATGSFLPCGSQSQPISPQVSYNCTGNGTATVIFNWGQPANGFSNYLDISLFDNGFLPGTFIGTPVNGLTSYSWPGILANLPTYWRLNSLGPAGWSPLVSGGFTAVC